MKTTITNHVDTTQTITHISLCAGYGGIDIGLERAIPNLRTIAFSEIEAFACANLVAKMEAGLMDCAPIWTNLKTFPWEQFHDRVDILSGGYPCQPFSAAGKRAGKDDPRHLWPYIADGIRICRPRICFFENVEGHISLGLPDVIEDLARLGYRTTWGIFSASEVGAPHQRKRVFILAVSNSLGGAAGVSRSLAWNERIAGEFDHGGGEGGDYVAYDQSEASRRLPERAQSKITRLGLNGQAAWPSRPGEQQFWWEPPRVVGGLAHAPSQRPRAFGAEPEGQQRAASIASAGAAMGNATQRSNGEQQAEQQGRHSVGGSGEEGAGEGLADTQGSEWRWTSGENNFGRGLEEAGGSNGASVNRQTQHPLGRDADGPAGGLDNAELFVSCDNRTDELRLLGNGVVPATAELAFRTLMGELTAQP